MRRAFLTLVALGAASQLVLAAPSAALPELLPPGDVNQDGFVNMADGLTLLRHLRGEVVLDARGEDAADIAPLSSGASAPDGNVDWGDFVVLQRLLRGDIGSESGTINAIPSPSPEGMVSQITGTAPPGATVHLFASNAQGLVVHVDTSNADAMGDYAFTSIPMLFDGTVEFFVVVDDGSGLRSPASNTVSASWATGASLNPLSTVSTTQVWPKQPAGDYQIDSSGLTILEGATLILGPGVVLDFPDSTGLTARGQLHAFGASNAEVTLTSGTFWNGVVFDADSIDATSYLSHVLVDNPSGIAADVVGGGPAQTEVIWRDSVVDVVSPAASGVRAFAASAVLSIEWTSVLGGPASDVGVEVTTASAPATILHSTISGFDDCIRDSSVLGTATQHKVRYSTISSCDTGFDLMQSRMQISPANRIVGNGIGLDVRGSGHGGVCPSNPPVVSCWVYLPTVNNSYLDNTINVRAVGSWWSWNIQSQPLVAMNAQANYWGMTDGEQIADSITDVADNLVASGVTGYVSPSSDGLLVDFTPFRVSEGGDLDYRYISGEVYFDFPDDPVDEPMRKAVGPVWHRRNRDPVTIPAGTEIEVFVDDVNGVLVDIRVESPLILAGTSSQPVCFVAPGPDPQPGDWVGINFDSRSSGNDLDYVEIEHATRAIYVEETDISINGADIRYFSGAGVVLDQIDVSSEILNSWIDGELVPGSPPITVKDDAQSNIVGIQVIDSYASCNTGGCGTVSGNTIRNLVTGIHVLGDSEPQIFNNTITDNIWGIWLEGTLAGDPAPTIAGNLIKENSGDTPLVPAFSNEMAFRFCSTQGGANLCLSDYAPSSAALIIDAQGNDWGDPDPSPDDVRNGVLITEGERVAVDLSGYVGSPAGFGSGFFSAVLAEVGGTGSAAFGIGSACRSTTWTPMSPGRAACVIQPTLSAVGFEIEYHLHRESDVTIEIFREDDTTGGALFTKAFTAQAATAGGTPHSYSWDGRFDPEGVGAFAPDGAYAWVLTATTTNAPVIVDRYDPPRDKQAFMDPDGPGGEAPLWVIGNAGKGNDPGNASTFNSFENDYITFQYDLEELPLRGLPFSSSVTAKVFRRDPSDLCEANEFGAGDLLATPWLDRALWQGSHILTWDGRATVEPGSGFSAGEIVPGAAPDDFCLSFEPPKPLKANHVIVANTLPTIRGTGAAPNVEVASDPFVVRPSYEQSAEMTFTVDQPSTVVLYILPPAVLDLGQAVGKVQAMGGATVPANTATPVTWQGWEKFDDPTYVGTNHLRAQTDGPYTFALEAISAADTSLVSIYRGVINIRGELPPGS